MNEEPDRKERNKRTFTTFKKRPFNEDSSAETDQRRYIMSLVCEVCCGSLVYIKNEARLRGIKKGLVNYAESITSIHLAANVEKH